MSVVLPLTVVVLAVAVLGAGLRGSRTHARLWRWTAAGALTAAALWGAVLAVAGLTGSATGPWAALALLPLPAAVLLGLLPLTTRLADRALLEAAAVAAQTLLAGGVFLIVVVGLGRTPTAAERGVLGAGLTAALLCALLAHPVRARTSGALGTALGLDTVSPQETLRTFGARMTRAVPFDELLLQLAESLRPGLGPAGVEIWVGGDGLLTRTVTVPDRPERRIRLNEHEQAVVGRTRIGGAGWCSIWLPGLLPEEDPAPVRVAPAAHRGELLGLIVVRRPVGADPYAEADDRVLVELGRQVGLALHNVRLDSALQASLSELKLRNQELRASRLRIVTAADASRRALERDLHDGAQQHLVALSVKLGLVREIAATEEPATVLPLLDELRGDVQEAVSALRELAHGIYPPLLRNHGLAQALRSAARRCPLPCAVAVDLTERHPEQVEAAVYFCCLEALQNAGKHAGPDAQVEVSVTQAEGVLGFTVRDTGPGLGDAGRDGSGFVNMADRLGAVGGRLVVESAPGQGTTVRGEIPLSETRPRSSEGVRSSLWT